MHSQEDVGDGSPAIQSIRRPPRLSSCLNLIAAAVGLITYDWQGNP